MNVMEAMKRKKEGKSIKRKLDNGLTEVKEFYDNGQIKCHHFEDENGKWHGEYKWWWSDGTIAIHEFYKKGNLHGEYKWWREDGTLQTHELYEDGKLVKDYIY